MSHRRVGRFYAVGLLISLAAGCTGEGTFRLHVVFPDDLARETVTEVVIWALKPEERLCERLSEGSVAFEDLIVHTRASIAFPVSGGGAMFPQVPGGDILFYAEGRSAPETTLLRACLVENVNGSEDVEVTLTFSWACPYDPGGEIPGNGLDDDCDGDTDECATDDDCDDGDGCTADFCTAEVCRYLEIPEGFACDDGNLCTTDDRCLGGNCAGLDRDCSAFDGPCVAGTCDAVTGGCAAAPRMDGTTCDDGLFCTVDDVCAGGGCVGASRDCDDGDDCTRDACSEGDARCDHVIEPRPGLEGLAVPGTCANGQDEDCDGLVDAVDPNCQECAGDGECNDMNPCTQDTCSPERRCENVAAADGSPCNDGSYCTVDDRCAQGVCGGDPRDCSSESDACHAGLCAEDQDNCIGQPRADGTACDDGQFCTVGDACQQGSCTGNDLDCADSDICTLDSCDEAGDQCEHALQADPGAEGPPGDPSCGNAADDDCDGQTDLEDGNCYDCLSDAECGDGNPCTSDACTGGVCQNDLVADGTACDDGNGCTRNDICTQGTCAGGLYTCDDANPCTQDICTGDGGCDHPAVQDGTPCGDAAASSCSAPDACLSGACDSNDTAQGTPCDDGLFCTGVDTCSGLGFCDLHTGDPCLPAVCDEALDECRGDPDLQETPVYASDGAESDRFGQGVGVSGDWAVVGAPGHDQLRGAVYVFHRDADGWFLYDELMAGDGQPNDYFGNFVSISGDRLIVGADGNDDHGSSSGSAYLFHRDANGWQFHTLLLPGSGSGWEYFGQVVGISGDVAVVSDRYDSDVATSAGAAFVYRFGGQGWEQEAKLTAFDGQASDEYGVCVAVSGDVVVVGAENANGDTGAAYVYRRDPNGTWLLDAHLLASDGVVADEYGVGCAVDGDLVAIGAITDDDLGSASGSVYVYSYTSGGAGWGNEVKLTASDGAAGDWFGRNVAISGDTLLVGAPFNDGGGADIGAVYEFRFDGQLWAEERKIQASDGAIGDQFGRGVSLDGTTALIGARYHDVVATDTGAAYFFELPPP